MTPVAHFPVVGEDGSAVGLLSKEKISREMADLESVGIEYEVIPDHLLTYEITDSIVLFFQTHRTIPVLNIFPTLGSRRELGKNLVIPKPT